jgi:DtxR family transcriptional regulator, Mn-dependent transcriptional regulator
MVAKFSGRQSASMEDYLETIAIIKEKGEPVTVTGISKAMEVKKPSVDCALDKLSEAGLILHEKYGDVELTAEGAKIANDVYHRHKILLTFLTDILGMDAVKAEKDACRMEHVLSRDGLDRLEKFIDFVLNCPRGNPEWMKGFEYFVEHGQRNTDMLAKCLRQDREG